MTLPLSLALTRNPRTWPVIDGRITAPGLDFTITTEEPGEIFWRQLKFADFDVSEMSLSSLMMTLDRGDDRFIGLPVFTTRRFFHTYVLVRKDAHIDTPADLKGKRGVATIGSPEGYWAALATRQIDGASVDLSSALQAERMGRGKILVVDGDLVKTFHANVIFATNKLIAESPEKLRDFLKGWYETATFMRTHKEETVAIARQIANVDADIASSTYDIVMKELSGDGKFNPKALDVLAESFVDMGLLDSKPDMGRFVTEEFLPR